MDQFAVIYWGDPTQIDIAEVLDAAESAAFTVHSMTLRSEGTVQHTQCKRCDSNHASVLLNGTKQAFSLAEGETATDGPLKFEANILGWNSSEPRLDINETPASAE